MTRKRPVIIEVNHLGRVDLPTALPDDLHQGPLIPLSMPVGNSKFPRGSSDGPRFLSMNSAPWIH